MIVNTSALLAFYDAKEASHDAMRAHIESESDALVVSPFVVAEVDYLVATRVGVEAELEVLRDLAGGAWELPSLSLADLDRAAKVIERYSDQAVGVADASIVVLADRYDTRTVATLDRRHFEVLRPLGGGRFSLIP